MNVAIYDTTLRDGCQAYGFSLSVDDKLRVAERLDELRLRVRRRRVARIQPARRRVFRTSQTSALAHQPIGRLR